MQKLILIATIASLVLMAVGCAGKPTAQPTAIAKAQSPKVSLITPENQKIMVTGKPSKFVVTLEPDSAQANVSEVRVYGDNEIVCTKSSGSDYVWYCTGGKAVEVATVFVRVTGDFPDSTAEYTVQVIAPTAVPPASAAVSSPVPATPTVAATEASGSTQSITPANTATPISSPGTVSCQSFRPPLRDTGGFAGQVEIATPRNCTTGIPAETSIPIAGTFQGIPADVDVWVLAYPPNLLYYPQSPNACAGAKMSQENGRWQVLAFLGKRGGAPEWFDIVVVLADQEASQFLSKWVQDGCKSGQWPGIPVAQLQQYKITEKGYIMVQTRD